MKLIELPVIWSNSEEFDATNIEPDFFYVNPELVFCVHDSKEIEGCSILRDASGTGYLVPLDKPEIVKRLTE